MPRLPLAWTIKERDKAIKGGCTCMYAEGGSERWFIANFKCPYHHPQKEETMPTEVTHYSDKIALVKHTNPLVVDSEIGELTYEVREITGLGMTHTKLGFFTESKPAKRFAKAEAKRLSKKPKEKKKA